ncbi:hypothetical protein J2W39_006406 [Variovorax paradoxus]|uniref:EamA family transporter n=1 Tax=Variovorax paradoxus TaxID=34073 RepID=A0AAW8ER26_VARPD|nr:hypothetical protein [Variovorax paradoxus]
MTDSPVAASREPAPILFAACAGMAYWISSLRV